MDLDKMREEIRATVNSQSNDIKINDKDDNNDENPTGTPFVLIAYSNKKGDRKLAFSNNAIRGAIYNGIPISEIFKERKIEEVQEEIVEEVEQVEEIEEEIVPEVKEETVGFLQAADTAVQNIDHTKSFNREDFMTEDELKQQEEVVMTVKEMQEAVNRGGENIRGFSVSPGVFALMYKTRDKEFFALFKEEVKSDIVREENKEAVEEKEVFSRRLPTTPYNEFSEEEINDAQKIVSESVEQTKIEDINRYVNELAKMVNQENTELQKENSMNL